MGGGEFLGAQKQGHLLLAWCYTPAQLLCPISRWNTTVQTLVASYEAYEDLMKKSQEGKDFYTDLEGKAAKLLEKARAACQAAEASRQQILEK